MICTPRMPGTCAPVRGRPTATSPPRGSSWQRARRVADALPANDPDRTAMRIRPRTMLCASTWRAGRGVADTGFDELRELCCQRWR